MKAVIPAAGRGTRMEEATRDRPKALVDVNERPLVEYAIEAARSAGFTELIIVVGYEGEQIVERYSDEDDISFVWQEEPNGVGHAIQQARDHIEHQFGVILGDSIFSHPQYTCQTMAVSDQTDGVIVTESVSFKAASEYATVHLDPTGVVEKVVEKPSQPTTRRVDTGWYMLPAEYMDVQIPRSDNGEHELQSGINRLIKDGYDFVTTDLTGWRINVNSLADHGHAVMRL